MAVFFELYPMVVFVPANASGNALVMGVGNRGGIVSDSAPDVGAAHWGERDPAHQLRKLCLVPLPAVPDSAGLSRLGNSPDIRGGTRKSEIDSRESGRSPLPRGDTRGRCA